MADTKISALTALTAANVATDDVVPIVDTSVTTTKKITAEELQGYVGSYAGLIQGLKTSNDTDTAHDILIATGRARSGDDTNTLVLSTAITKQIDATWAVGTNLGGLDTGAVAADTWYYIWLIKRTDTGVVDALFSTSSTAPTMPANYDKKRLIAAIRTDGSANIEQYYQVKDWFYRQTYETVLNGGTATAATAVTLTSGVPTEAAAFACSVEVSQTHNNQSIADSYITLRVAAGVDWLDKAARDHDGSGNSEVRNVSGQYNIPNTGTFQYFLTNTNTNSSNATIKILGFELTR